MTFDIDMVIRHCEEKAKELRTKTGYYTQNGCGYFQASEVEQKEIADCLECAKEHEQLAEWLTELKERREADRWIPVSERLPNKEGRYWITDNEGLETDDIFSEVYGFMGFNVIAWQPLPGPYKENGK